MEILHVVGARPNFMKVAPVLHALRDYAGIQQTLVHTGQHYDARMSDVFFEQLDLPAPDLHLAVGSGTHGAQTGQIMIKFEEALLQRRPNWVVVYGDVNSTVAATLVASKLQIPVAHVEAGLRSGDRTMPEELNRLVTDQLSDMLLTPSRDGDRNLLREGIAAEKIHFVGNVMIDTLVRLLPKARLPKLAGLSDRYALVTLHRPSNVDDPAGLAELMAAIRQQSRKLQIVFPIHPRTRARLQQLGETDFDPARILLTEPVGYLEFIALQKHASLIVTDSGGIQEESTYLQVPCLTLRENTERPVTVELGTNQLLGRDFAALDREVDSILAGNGRRGRIPPLWDGQSGGRIAEFLMRGAAPAQRIRRAA